MTVDIDTTPDKLRAACDEGNALADEVSRLRALLKQAREALRPMGSIALAYVKHGMEDDSPFAHEPDNTRIPVGWCFSISVGEFRRAGAAIRKIEKEIGR